MRRIVPFSLLLCTLAAALAGCKSSTGPNQTAARLVLEPATVTLGLAATRPVVVVALNADDRPITADVEWSSSNTAVAEVNGAGAIVARGLGTAVLTATMDGVEADLVTMVVPLQMTVCEKNFATVCGSWVWQTDHYAGTWEDGATASIVVKRFDTQAWFNREDFGKNKDFAATYSGVVNPGLEQASGGVAWSISGQVVQGTFTAQW